MKQSITQALRGSFLAALFVFGSGCAQEIDPLPSWQDGPSKRAIMDFVADVTSEDSPNFVPVPERIAAFDNDGTLWGEQPMYFQLAFALDRVRDLAVDHPEWQTEEPFASALRGDAASVFKGGIPAILRLVMATHAGNSPEEFKDIVRNWIDTARHPVSGKPYTEMVYQPMLEVLDLLRANGFKTYIVSAGGTAFMRPWTERVYGIPPEQVYGSMVKTSYHVDNGVPTLTREAEIGLINDGEAKPLTIQQNIGRRPIAAFGNSDGDLEMLRWTTAGPGARLGVIVHHTDGERETAYDRGSSIGGLDVALDVASTSSWTVVDMKTEWVVLYPWQK